MTQVYDTDGLTAQQMMLVDMELKNNRKDKTVVVLLWLFFAAFGAHRFYLGHIGYAVAMMLLGWITLFIWPLIDIILALKETDRMNEEARRHAINRVRATT